MKKYAKNYLKFLLKTVYGKKYKSIYKNIKKNLQLPKNNQYLTCEIIEFYIIIKIILNDTSFFYYKKELNLKNYFLKKIKTLKQNEIFKENPELKDLLNKTEKEIDNIPELVFLLNKLKNFLLK